MGHILFGVGFQDTADLVEKNIESLGFKLTDIKAILLNHAHGDQSGAAAEFRKKTGAQVMTGFAEVQFLEHGGVLPGGMPHVPRMVHPRRPRTSNAPAKNQRAIRGNAAVSAGEGGPRALRWRRD